MRSTPEFHTRESFTRDTSLFTRDYIVQQIAQAAKLYTGKAVFHNTSEDFRASRRELSNSQFREARTVSFKSQFQQDEARTARTLELVKRRKSLNWRSVQLLHRRPPHRRTLRHPRRRPRVSHQPVIYTRFTRDRSEEHSGSPKIDRVGDLSLSRAATRAADIKAHSQMTSS